MSSFEISGPTKWKVFGFSAPDIGHASISLDSIQAFDGKAIGNRFAFEITDMEGELILRSTPEPQSTLLGWLGQGSHVFRDQCGEELARVRYSGPFGFCRAFILDGQELPCPRCRNLVFPGATIMQERRQVFRADIRDHSRQLAYLGLAFYLWLRADTDSA